MINVFPMMPDISVIIPTHNRKNLLLKCLESLFDQNVDTMLYEIIVVDDGSTDGTKEALEEIILKSRHKLSYFFCEHKGSPAAKNLGIAKARSEVLAFVDDDCTVPRNWIKKIKYYHENYPDILVIQGKIENMVKNSLLAALEQDILDEYLKVKNIRNGAIGVNFLAAGNCSFKRKAFSESNLYFHENFIAAEEVDLVIRMKMKGLNILYAEDLLVFHKHRSSFVGLLKRSFRDGRGRATLKSTWEKESVVFDVELHGAIFFIIMCRNYFAKYNPLSAFLMVIMHLLRKIFRTLGFVYELVKQRIG